MANAAMATRAEVIKRYEAKYLKASKKEKSRILDSIHESTGISRSRARRILTGSGVKKQKKRRPRRAPEYDAAFAAVLEKMWVHMDFACGRRLVAGMEDMLEALQRCGEFETSEEILAKLKTVSAATADRLLAKAKKGLILKGEPTTKPGTLLKKDIPIRMGNEWDDAVPGFVEIDLVAHCGESTAGDYVNTLDVTDICTGWTETAAVLSKAQIHVSNALKDIEKRQPFDFKGIDSDNGNEFFNHHLYRWCKERGIVFTRGRPYKKNDNCHAEQKIGTSCAEISDIRALKGKPPSMQ
ncbi:MAG: transposase [Defluviitaleaceae bacterium]|nr:transposase [Defluviitaleaceae bacterium]